MSSTAQLEWTTRQEILGPDPSALLFQEVSRWFEKVKSFQREEDERMYLKDPTAEDLAVHKELILRLIDDGEHLVKLINRRGGLGPNPRGITGEDVEATIECLGYNYRGWHEPMPKDKRDRILKQIFGDVP